MNHQLLSPGAEKTARRLSAGLVVVLTCYLFIYALTADMAKILSYIPDDAAYYMKMGQAVLVPQAPTEGGVRIYSKSGSFLGVGCILDDGKVQPKRLLRSG